MKFIKNNMIISILLLLYFFITWDSFISKYNSKKITNKNAINKNRAVKKCGLMMLLSGKK